MHRHTRQTPPARSAASRAGQAIVEFVVAIVAVLVVTVAILQIARLGYARTTHLMQAREEAGRFALSSLYIAPVLPGPQYVSDWNTGPDGARYSADDSPAATVPAGISSHIADRARPQDLAVFLPGNAVTPMAAPAGVLPGFFLVHGSSRSEPIPLLPAVRRLLYAADSITIEQDVWMVWTSGIY